MAVNVENYGSQQGDEQYATATGGFFTKLAAMFVDAFKDTVKKTGNAFIKDGLGGMSPQSNNTGTNTGNGVTSSNIAKVTKKYVDFNSKVEKLIENLDSGKDSLTAFNETGNQLEILASHFNKLDEAAINTISNFKKTGVVSKELTGLLKEVSIQTAQADSKSLKVLSNNLEMSKKGVKGYLLEMVGVATAAVGAVVAAMYPFISAGLEQQQQINELSKMTDDLLTSSKNQRVFSETTRALSIAYGTDLKEVRNLFADVASDLGLSYKQIATGSEKSYGTVNEELNTYLKQALTLKKTTDLEEKTLRGLYKTVKLVGVNSKDAGGLVKVFTNSLTELRALNKITKTDVEEIAESIQEMALNLGFAGDWGADQIAAMTTQYKNMIKDMENIWGEGGITIGNLIAKNLSTGDPSDISGLLAIDINKARDAIDNQDLTPVYEGFRNRLNKMFVEVQDLKQRGSPGFVIDDTINALFGGELDKKQINAFKQIYTQMKKTGGLADQSILQMIQNRNIMSPEANKKLDEMQSNLAGIMDKLSGTKSKFMEVFGAPLVAILAPVVKLFGYILDVIMAIVNILPDWMKGLVGIGAGILAIAGIGAGLSSLLGITTALGVAWAAMAGAMAAALWPVTIFLAVVAAIYGLHKVLQQTFGKEYLDGMFAGVLKGIKDMVDWFKGPKEGMDFQVTATVTEPEFTKGLRNLPLGTMPTGDLYERPPTLTELAEAWQGFKDWLFPLIDSAIIASNEWIESIGKGFRQIGEGFISLWDFMGEQYKDSWLDKLDRATITWLETLGQQIGTVWTTATTFLYDSLVKSSNAWIEWFGQKFSSIIPDWIKNLFGADKASSSSSQPTIDEAVAPQKRGTFLGGMWEGFKNMFPSHSSGWVSDVPNNLNIGASTPTATSPVGGYSSSGLFPVPNYSGYLPTSNQPLMLSTPSITTPSPDYNLEFTPAMRESNTASPTDVKQIELLKQLVNNTTAGPMQSVNAWTGRITTVDERVTLAKTELLDKMGSA